MDIIEKKELIIDDNKKKYDIVFDMEINNNFKIIFAKKRIMNLFKNVSFNEKLEFGFSRFNIHMYLASELVTFPEEIFNRNDYIIIGIFNNEIVLKDKLIEILEMYKVINVMTRNVI